MKWPWQREQQFPAELEQRATAELAQKEISLDTLLRQLAELNTTVGGVNITPDNAMKSPTVHAIVTAVSNRLATSPIKVMQKTRGSNGRENKEPLPNHPVARLLRKPNQWQTPEDYVADAVSSLMRWGTFYSFKSRGQTGPILELIPLESAQMEVRMDKDIWRASFRYRGQQDYTFGQMLYARLGSRNFYEGDSPVMDVKESIALEIAAEQFGSAFFGNGALPLLYFELQEGFSGFQSEEDQLAFLTKVKSAFGGNKAFSTMMLPKGMELSSMDVANDKAQFIETRKFIRTVIAGAFNVPPHLVGDLERSTFNNVEQQDTDFTLNAVMPIARKLEAAMERDLLTQEDRRNGIVIRFNLDAMQRADIKTRNESLRLAREWGAINANEWREHLNMNPISADEGGEDYIRPMNAQTKDEAEAAAEAANNTGNGEGTPNVPAEGDEGNTANGTANGKGITVEPHIQIVMPQQTYNMEFTPESNVALNIEKTNVDIAETNVNVEPTKVDVVANIETPEVKIGDTNVNVEPTNVDVHAEMKAPDITIGKTEVTVEPTQMTLELDTPNVEITHNYSAPDINVEPPEIHMGDVNVEAPEVKVENNMDTPVVNVQPAEVLVENKFDQPDVIVTPPDIKVEANFDSPDLHIENNVETPEVTVLPAEVKVDNTFEQPEVKIENNVEAPEVNIEPAQVQVDAKFEQPEINIDNHVDTPEVTVQPAEVKVENQFAQPEVQINVDTPEVVIEPALVKVDNNFAQPDVNINVDTPEVNIEPAQVTVENKFEQPEVKIDNHIEAPEVTVEPALVKVENQFTQPEVNIENKVDVPTPEVIVEPAQINVENKFEQPEVKIDNHIDTPEVVVEPAQVNVENVVETPEIKIDNHVEAPEVNVQPPEVNVEAPFVKVENTLPEIDEIETTPVRDKEGKITKTIQKRKRSNARTKAKVTKK